MFNFKKGVPAAVTSMKALVGGLGFQISEHYDNTQVAIFNENWNVLADFGETYICYSKVGEKPVLKKCVSPEEVEHEFMHLLQQIVQT